MDIRPAALGGIQLNTGKQPSAAAAAKAAAALASATLPQQSATQGVVPILPVGMAEQALAYAQIPLTQETMQMIETLIGNEMPIDKDALASFYQLAKMYPDADVETLALMQKHDIPITRENIEAFVGYRNLENQLRSELTNLIETLPQLTGELAGELSAAELLQWNDKLVDILLGGGETAEAVPSEPSGEAPPTAQGEATAEGAQGQAQIQLPTEAVNGQPGAQAPIEELPGGQTQAAPVPEGVVAESAAGAQQAADMPPPAADAVPEQVRSALRETLRQGDVPQGLAHMLDSETVEPKELMKEISAYLKGLPQQGDERAQTLIKTLLSSKGYGELMQEALKSELLLKPESFSKQEVTAFYQKLYEDAGRIATELGSLHGELAQTLSETAQGVHNNLAFLGDLAQSFSYLELPLHLAGDYVQGDLYVFKNKKSGGINPDDLKVLLHLDLGELGLLDIYINLQGQTVRSRFYAGSDSTLSMIQEGVPQLESALRDKGFNPNTDVRPRTGQEGDAGFDFVRDFLEQRSAGERLEHYSLNVKV